MANKIILIEPRIKRIERSDRPRRTAALHFITTFKNRNYEERRVFNGGYAATDYSEATSKYVGDC